MGLFPFFVFGEKENSVIVSIENQVDFAVKEGPWINAQVGQNLNYGDRVRTGEFSRATIQLPNESVMRINELTTITLKPPKKTTGKPGIDLRKGALYFFSRNQPDEYEFGTPTTTGAIKGTEFELHLDSEENTVMTLFDGEVDLSNAQGSIALVSGEQGTVKSGSPPIKTAVINAVNIIQWCLYYPAVVDVDEISFSQNEINTFAASIESYRKGNILEALSRYLGMGAKPESEASRIYAAGLYLATGQVNKAEELIAEVRSDHPLTLALKELITAVKEPLPNTYAEPQSTSHWLARSYLLQAEGELELALKAARKAVELSPEFGFGWGRVAELEFSFGRSDAVKESLDLGLKLAPENAQNLALQGFIFAGDNQLVKARDKFEQAIIIDGALANAWLGRGLTQIRDNDLDGGMQNLQVASAIEPNRSLLRSYLAKAFSDAKEFSFAANELTLAEMLDPSDPTPWFFSALLNQKINRYNVAVTDLKRSMALNENRRLYRSKFLLDQDQAVRSANLAAIYNNVGMREISIREAHRAVQNDYTNYSAHLFLANSYDALRDPRRFQLRFETPWANELLLANLLSPASAGTLSQYVSQQEYTPLFERQRLGLNAHSTYQSHGEFRQLITQYGLFGDTSYAVDFDYHTFDGYRLNNEFDRVEVFTQLKHQLTAQGTVFLQLKFQDFDGGDVSQIWDNSQLRPDFHFEEEQIPLVFAGYHHRWSPGIDTLFLFGRLTDELVNRDLQVPQLILSTDAAGERAVFPSADMDLFYRNELEIYSAEITQIFQFDTWTFIGGLRYQDGDFEVQNRLTGITPIQEPFFDDPPADFIFKEGFNRVNLYLYSLWEVLDNLTVTAGVSYDSIDYPLNLLTSPISSGQLEDDQVSPKVGMNWDVNDQISIRAAYSQSLGGFSFDQSVRLEPSQISGFTQGFRSLISESAVGAVPASEFEVAGLGVTLNIDAKTYLDLHATIREANVERFDGVFNDTGSTFFRPGVIREVLNYEEDNLTVALNHLLGEMWSLGVRYEYTRSDLDQIFETIPDANFNFRSTLHQLNLFAIINHPSGWHAKAEGRWVNQDNRGFLPDFGDDDFFQIDAFFGYRAPGQRWQLTAGAVNLTDENYRLNPLNTFLEFPREVAFWLKFDLNL